MIEKYPTFKFVRGDTQGFVVKATFIDGTPIQQIDIKDILITCRQFPYKSSNIIFQKGINGVKVDNDGLHFTIEPKDTENLEYGEYAFDIQVTTTNDIVKTSFAHFILTDETTINEV